jgi:hypothetical protein
MCFSSISQRKNVVNKQADPESCNHKVKLQDLLFLGGFDGYRRIRWLGGKEYDNGSDTTDGQIDPEAL